jgi:hypothetical protein
LESGLTLTSEVTIMLSADQENNLIQIITEEYGCNLNKFKFSDRCLQLFEDIAGFESLTDLETKNFITLLWSKYDNH